MIRIRLRDTFWIEDTNNTEDCIDILFAINKSWVDELFDLLLTRLSLFCNIIDRQYINEKDVGIWASVALRFIGCEAMCNTVQQAAASDAFMGKELKYEAIR